MNNDNWFDIRRNFQAIEDKAFGSVEIKQWPIQYTLGRLHRLKFEAQKVIKDIELLEKTLKNYQDETNKLKARIDYIHQCLS